jgi:hypothetical protein
LLLILAAASSIRFMCDSHSEFLSWFSSVHEDQSSTAREHKERLLRYPLQYIRRSALNLESGDIDLASFCELWLGEARRIVRCGLTGAGAQC